MRHEAIARTGSSTPASSTTSTGSAKHESLLTPAEVAALFRVDPKTVTRWAKAGKLAAIRTLGGHRRFRESEVKALLVTEPIGQ
jgi:excisionase family DNA binding protein